MFKKKSDKFPTLSTNSNVLAFVKLTCSEIWKVNTSCNRQYNLLEAKREALQSLAANSTITIKPSDKGDNIVIINNEYYVEMCNKILSNKQPYCKVSPTKIEKFHQEFYSLVDETYAANILSKSEWDYVRTTLPRTPTFYSLPKLHKSMHHPSGRPINSGNGSLIENLSQFVDGHLCSHVLNLLSYITQHASPTDH